MSLSYRNQCTDLPSNHWTDFYMIVTSVMKELVKFNIAGKKGNSTTVILFLGHVSQNLSVKSGVQITYVLKGIWTVGPE